VKMNWIIIHTAPTKMNNHNVLDNAGGGKLSSLVSDKGAHFHDLLNGDGSLWGS